MTPEVPTVQPFSKSPFIEVDSEIQYEIWLTNFVARYEAIQDTVAYQTELDKKFLTTAETSWINQVANDVGIVLAMAKRRKELSDG